MDDRESVFYESASLTTNAERNVYYQAFGARVVKVLKVIDSLQLYTASLHAFVYPRSTRPGLLLASTRTSYSCESGQAALNS